MDTGVWRYAPVAALIAKKFKRDLFKFGFVDCCHILLNLNRSPDIFKSIELPGFGFFPIFFE